MRLGRTKPAAGRLSGRSAEQESLVGGEGEQKAGLARECGLRVVGGAGGVGGARLLSARPPGDGVYTCLGQWSQAPEVLCLHPLSEDTDQGNIVQGGWGVVRVVQMGGPGEPHAVTVWWKVQDDCKRHAGGAIGLSA